MEKSVEFTLFMEVYFGVVTVSWTRTFGTVFLVVDFEDIVVNS